jgi:hypothetical protein
MNVRAALLLFSVAWIPALPSTRPGPAPQGPAPVYANFEKRFTIEIRNPGPTVLENHPLVVRIDEIRKAVPDFNPLNCALGAGGEKRIIPHQADDLDGDGKPDELAFVATLAPGANAIVCYYSPKGRRTMSFPVKTSARMAWEQQNANIGWESNAGSYRLYYGQIEGFGKLYEYLILPALTADYTYHDITEWGMDILHVGAASGLGGISLWEGDARIPAMNPENKGDVRIDRKVLATGPVRGLVRVDLSNIRSAKGEHRVTLILSAFADNTFSRQDITIDSPGGAIVYSPGIEKLAGDSVTLEPSKGFLAAWGPGAPGAGEIGLGLIFDPAEYAGFTENALDRYAKLKIPAGQTRTHWILAGWSKGFAAPVPPTAQGFAKQVEELGRRLRTALEIKIITR